MTRFSMASAALCAAALSFAPSAVAQDGGVTPGDLVAGDSCVAADDQCGTGTVCATAFQGGDPACFNTCDTAGATCDGLDGQGACTQIDEAGTLVCIAINSLGGACGNVANASCDPLETALCLSFAAGEPGICAAICTPADPTTCSQAAQFNGAPGCGCVGTQVCSSSPLALQSGDGVCAQPNIDGSCGTNPNTGVIEVCTNNQQCGGIQDISGYGTCAGDVVEPSVGEPGVPEPGAGPGAEPGVGEPGAGEPGVAEPEGRTEPEPEPEETGDGCSASDVPSNGVPAALGVLGLLGLALRRRRR